MPVTAFLGAPRAAGVRGLGAITISRAGLAPRRLGTRPIRELSTARIGRQCGCLPILARSELRQGLQRGSLRTLSTSLPRFAASPSPAPQQTPKPAPENNEVQKDDQEIEELHESPYTLPNALTVARILACPFLAWSIVKGEFALATGILVTSGLTDWVDGYLARKWNQKTVLGSILDPMADKTLVTTLVVCLAYKGLLPLPLALLIFGRDFGLSMTAFYLRYKSLPPPRTFKRYWDPTMPSAEVKPTQISKVNTALQLFLMASLTISPLLTGVPMLSEFLTGLEWLVAITTVWSGLSYASAAGFKVLKQPIRKTTPKP